MKGSRKDGQREMERTRASETVRENERERKREIISDREVINLGVSPMYANTQKYIYAVCVNHYGKSELCQIQSCQTNASLTPQRALCL